MRYVRIRDRHASRPVYVILDATAGGERAIVGLWVGKLADGRRGWWGRLRKAAIEACDNSIAGSIPLAWFLP